MGEDLPGPRLSGGHRLSEVKAGLDKPTWTRWASTWWATAAPPASATPAPCRRTSRTRSTRATWWRSQRAVGQPQLRGPGEPRRAGQLPGLAAARGRLCAGRLDADRPDVNEPLGTIGQGRRARLPARHLADQRRDRRPSSARSSPGRPVQAPATPTSSRATRTGRTIKVGRRPDLRLGRGDSTYVQNPPYFEGLTMTPGAGDGHPGRRDPGHLRRLDHHRPHLPGRERSARPRRRAST